MTVILGFTAALLRGSQGELNREQRESLERVQRNARLLLGLINDVLDISKIEAGRMELNPADYLVPDIVATVRTSLAPLAAEKGTEFVATAEDDLPVAFGDGKRITQCLVNLAGNALKFTRRGRVEIRVERQGELLLYRVSDTGIGIPRNRLDHIFSEFRQADPTIAKEFGGTGLGLSITKKFVELHGGRIWVESEPGRGSTFFFTVPLRLAKGAAA
jgi:signal transduction histidine kinase